MFVCNDWHTGPLSCYLKSNYQSHGIYRDAKVAFSAELNNAVFVLHARIYLIWWWCFSETETETDCMSV